MAAVEAGESPGPILQQHPGRVDAFGVRGTGTSPGALRDGEQSASQICSTPLGQSLLLSVAK